MIFTLEALPARHGDSLVLHFGETGRPRFIVIDGGPTGVYNHAFRPRLDELAAREADGNGQLRIEVLMVSHMDDDHIRGVLDLSNELIAVRGTQTSPFRVETLWHNAFSDALGSQAGAAVASTLSEAPATVASAGGPAPAWSGRSEAVVQSVPQARELRDNARALGWDANAPFGQLVVAPPSGGRRLTFGPLTLTVVGPLQDEVDALAADWARKVRKLLAARDAREASIAASSIDDSVYNLSSIVCLAELDGKRILLTGDALGEKVLEGLERAGLLRPGGTIEVDVLKLPHHGSARNVTPEFFERIQAKHYVASGNGRFNNPEPKTLQMIADSRPRGPRYDEFEIHLTYDQFQDGLEPQIQRFLADKDAKGREYRVIRRGSAERSVRVDLLDPVTY